MIYECWWKTIETKLLALKDNHTQDVVLCPSSMKLVGSKWVFFLLSFQSNSYGDRYKVQLVVLANRQKYDLDYNETFILVAKMTTMHIIIALVAYQSWPLHQMDVNNTFLHDDLNEETYIKLLSSMSISTRTDICKLNHSLYGLKQAPKAWFEKSQTTLIVFSLTQSQYDLFPFLYKKPNEIAILLVYVDNIIVTSPDMMTISEIQKLLNSTFYVKDLGQLIYFLRLKVHCRSQGIFFFFFYQNKYIQDLV